MTDFNALIKQTLAGLTEKFKEACGDLNEMVARISDDIQAVTGVPLKLHLSKSTENISGTQFQLQVHSETGGRAIFSFFVPAKGYPIQILDSKTSMANRSELESVFAEMVSNPDSPLMQNIAFAVRQKQTVGR
jgi:hypothetical protein